MRAQILNGAERPQGLSAILYHGLLRGLQVLTKKPVALSDQIENKDDVKNFASHDANLVRLLANMILHKKSEMVHAY